MKKKVVSLLMALAMVSLVCVSAFAAGSVTEVAAQKPVTETVEVNSAKVHVVTNTKTDAVTAEHKESARKVVGEKIQNAEKISFMDVSLQDDAGNTVAVPAGSTIDITFNIGSGVTGDVRVMHWNGKEWEDVTVAGSLNTAAGTVQGRFSSLSPVALVYTAAKETPTTPETGNSESPKTGDAGMVTLAWVALAAAGAGAGFASRKKK